jgi:hypothetical protein
MPRRGWHLPRHGPRREPLSTTSVPNDEKCMLAILREAEERYENELLDVEERMLLLDRIKRLRRRLRVQAAS